MNGLWCSVMDKVSFPKVISNNPDCTGCGACVHSCESKAISLLPDATGRYLPSFDAERCVECGTCDDVCPVLNGFERKGSPRYFALMADATTRENSTSGGAFSIIAKAVFGKGGVVFGAIWNKDHDAVISPIYGVDQIDAVRHSKYVMSLTGDSYIRAKELLEAGKHVLYTGLPCQIAGLYAFLQRDYDRLLTVDLLCSGAPYPLYLHKYLESKHNGASVANVTFRCDGKWDPHTHLLEYEDGSKEICSTWTGDAYQQARHACLMMDNVCMNCRFSHIPRCGDITIGDFWGIDKVIPGANDGKGTSILLANTEKGMKILDTIEKNADLFVEVEAEKALKTPNRIDNRKATWYAPEEDRRDFNYAIRHYPFNKALDAVRRGRFDLGIVTTFSRNYGGNLTYYVLFKLLESMGLTSVFIERRKNAPSKPHIDPLRMYRVAPYPNYSVPEPPADYREIVKYNDICDSFIIGSDQMWHPNFIKKFGFHTCMDWVRSNKRKVAFSTSFGVTDFETDGITISNTKELLSRFDSISVRENNGVKILREVFGIDSCRTLDPVFMCGMEVWSDLIANSNKELVPKTDYVFGYVLDPSKNKARIVNSAQSLTKMDGVVVGDPYIEPESYKSCGIKVQEGVSVEDWLVLLSGSKYVVTDSFHGACFALIFKKPFLLIINKYRGRTRVDTLIDLFDIQDRVCEEEDDFALESLISPLDVVQIDEVIRRERERSLAWLNSALFSKIPERMTDSWDEKIACLCMQEDSEPCLDSIIQKCSESLKELSKSRSEAIVNLEEAAKHGSKWAEHELVSVLMHSNVYDDRVKAFRLCKGYVESGDSSFLGVLALMYLGGLGTAHNLDLAISHMRKAADSGSEWAKIELVSILMHSVRESDNVMAFKTCKEYVDAGVKKLCGKLALIYRDGVGTVPDIEMARYYLQLAADNGSTWAIQQLKKW